MDLLKTPGPSSQTGWCDLKNVHRQFFLLKMCKNVLLLPQRPIKSAPPPSLPPSFSANDSSSRHTGGQIASLHLPTPKSSNPTNCAAGPGRRAAERVPSAAGSLTGFKTHSLPDETVPWPGALSPLPLPLFTSPRAAF